MEEKREDKERPQAKSLKNFIIPGKRFSLLKCVGGGGPGHTQKYRKSGISVLIIMPVTIINTIRTRGN